MSDNDPTELIEAYDPIEDGEPWNQPRSNARGTLDEPEPAELAPIDPLAELETFLEGNGDA